MRTTVQTERGEIVITRSFNGFGSFAGLREGDYVTAVRCDGYPPDDVLVEAILSGRYKKQLAPVQPTG